MSPKAKRTVNYWARAGVVIAGLALLGKANVSIYAFAASQQAQDMRLDELERREDDLEQVVNTRIADAISDQTAATAAMVKEIEALRDVAEDNRAKLDDIERHLRSR